MLEKLNLQKYEKNFKKGMSTDSTLHLLNDRFVTATYTFNLFLFHNTTVKRRSLGMKASFVENCAFWHSIIFIQ